MKAIFSSWGLAAKVDRSRKFKVETGKEEKNGAEGKVNGVSLECAVRVIKLLRSSVAR
jgi:hypothetical protein